MRLVTEWFKRNFSDPQILFLTLGLIGVFAIILVMGDILLPVLASIVIAYLLEGLVGSDAALRYQSFDFSALCFFTVYPRYERDLVWFVADVVGSGLTVC